MSKGMRFEKIHQGQILKGLNSWELGNRSSESSKGTQLDLVGQRTYVTMQKIKLLWEEVYLSYWVALRGDIPVPQNSFKTECRKSLGGAELHVAEFCGALEQWVSDLRVPQTEPAELVSHPVVLKWGLRICIFNKLLSAAVG